MVTAMPTANTAKIPSPLWIGNISITSGLDRLSHSYGWSIQTASICTFFIAIAVFFSLRNMLQRNGIAFIWRSPLSLSDTQKDIAILNLEWWTLLLLMLIFSPESTRHHLILVFNFNLLAAGLLLFPKSGVKRWPILLAILFEQLGEIGFKIPLFSHTDYLGLPGWTYLIFLLVVFRSFLIYYQTIYSPSPSLLSTLPISNWVKT